ALVAVAVLLGGRDGGGGVGVVGRPDLGGGAADDGAGAAVNVANGLRDAVETGGVDDAVLIEVEGGDFAFALNVVGVEGLHAVGVAGFWSDGSSSEPRLLDSLGASRHKTPRPP